MAAVRGRPTLVIVEPILEIAWPPQSLRKSRSRVRAPEDIPTVCHGGLWGGRRCAWMHKAEPYATCFCRQRTVWFDGGADPLVRGRRPRRPVGACKMLM